MPAPRNDDAEDEGSSLQVGDRCEALLHGKWFDATVTRCGIRGEVNIELVDGTQVEDLDASRVRSSHRERRRERWSDWECVEAMAVDSWERRGGVGRRPSLVAATSRDEKRRLEQLVHREDLERYRDAFRRADSVGAGELDIDDTLAALSYLNRVASRADVLDYARRRRALDFVEFCKCLARLFHEPDVAPVPVLANPEKETSGAVSAWARALGRERLVAIEDVFQKHCAPFTGDRGESRLGLEVRDVRTVLRELDHDLTPSRLAAILRESGLEPDDVINFVEFAKIFRALDSAAELPRRHQPDDGELRPLAEIAAAVFAQARWDGTATQHASLVRRLCVGRPPNVQDLVRRAKDEFERQDIPRTGALSSGGAEVVLSKIGLAGNVVKETAKTLFRRRRRRRRRRHPNASTTDAKEEEDDDESQEVSLAEWFAIAGPLLEASAETASTVPSAFARLRLKCAPAEVRVAGELVAQYLTNVLAQPGEKQRWRVPAENAAYMSKVGRLDGGLQLMKAVGFSQRVLLENARGSGNKREWLVLRGAFDNEKPIDRLPPTFLAKLQSKLHDVERELASYLGAPGVATALRKMRAKGATPKALREAVALAHRCATNVLKHPTDPKVYRVRVANQLVQTKILGLSCGMDLARAIGFAPDADGTTLELCSRSAKLKHHKSNRDFSFPKLDPETEAFLYRAVSDLEEAMLRLDAEITKQYPKCLDEQSAKKKTINKKASRKGELEQLLARGTRVQQAQLGMAQRAFAAYDKDGDGVVSKDDLRLVFQTLGRRSTDVALDKWIGRHDFDKDGCVSFADFLASLAPMFQMTQRTCAPTATSADSVALDVASAIAAAIGTLRLGAALIEVRETVSTVLGRVQHIVEAPANSQLWRVRVAEPEFKRRVADYAGGIQLMLACGFALEENATVVALRAPRGDRWDRVPAGVLAQLRRARDELRGRLVSLEHPEVADVSAIASAAGRLDAASGRKLLPAVDLCAKYLKNVMSNPSNDRLRRVSSDNPIFRERVLTAKGGLELFVATGWREVQGGGAFFLPDDVDSDQIQARLLELEACSHHLRKHKNDKQIPSRVFTRSKKRDMVKSPLQKESTTEPSEAQKAFVQATSALLSKAETAKKRALEQARDAKHLADSLAAELHEVKARQRQKAQTRPVSQSTTTTPTTTQETPTPKKKKRKPAVPMRFAHAPELLGQPLKDKSGAIGQEVLHDVKSQLVEAAPGGTNVLRILRKEENDGWRIGFKARVGSARGTEERFVAGIGEHALLLNKPLTFNHAAGETAVMVRPSSDERKLFHSAQLIMFIHLQVLVPAIEMAAKQGQAIIEAREAQREFEARPVPRPVYLAHQVFSRSGAKLVSVVPRLGLLLLRETTDRERLVSFAEGFTLSDLRRLFDRINVSGSGHIALHELSAAVADDPDVAVLFAERDLATIVDDMCFLDDFVPRFLSIAREEDVAVHPPQLSLSDAAEIAVVFRHGCMSDGKLPASSLPYTFAELEGVPPDLEEHLPLAEAVTTNRSLSFEELIALRELYVRRLGVPLGHDGTYRGAGINGWRRHALAAMRPVWATTVAAASKATGEYLDAAPGYDLYHALCSSDAVGAFLMLQLRPNVSLRDELHNTIVSANAEAEAESYLTWRQVEALVYSETSTSIAVKPNEIFRAGPKVLVENLHGVISCEEDTAPTASSAIHVATKSLAQNKTKIRNVQESVVDSVRSRVFVLSNDGVLEVWDALCERLCDPTPLRLITPAPPSATESVAPELSVDLVVHMLALKPRCQSLLLDNHSRLLVVNTTAGDGCVRFHEVNTFSELARIRLALPIGGCLLFDQSVRKVGDGRSPRGSHGAVSAYAFLPEDQVLLTSVVGDAVLRAFSSRSGEVLALMPGHLSAVGPVVYARSLELLASGSTDCCVRVWDVGRNILPAIRSRSSPMYHQSPVLERVRSVLRKAVTAVGLSANWRNGVITAVIDSTLLGDHAEPVIEVEYDDDHSIEFVSPARLHKRPTPHPRLDCGGLVRRIEARSGLNPAVPMETGAEVSVWHTYKHRSVQRLFSKFTSTGLGNLVHYEDFLDIFAELCRTYGSEADKAQITENDVWRAVLALDAENRGFVGLRAFESFLLSEDDVARQQLGYVAAQRVLRGHSAPVCAVVFLKQASIVASASNDGTIRLWDLNSARHNLVWPTHVHHWRHSPGHYTELPDEWNVSPGPVFTLKLSGVNSLQSVVLKSRVPRSRIEPEPRAVSDALELDKQLDDAPAGKDRVRGVLYLLDDGTVRSLAVPAFDERLLTLAIEDAGFFNTEALNSIFEDRQHILRAAFVTSTAYAALCMIIEALEAHQYDAHPLAFPGGGNENMLRVLQINLVLFTSAGDSVTNDVRHLIQSKPTADTSVGCCCEMLLAEASGSSVAAWAIGRALLASRADLCHRDLLDPDRLDIHKLALRQVLGSWRFALHAYRTDVVKERRGMSAIAASTSSALQACFNDGVRVLMHASNATQRKAARRSFETVLGLFDISTELRLASQFCLDTAFARLQKKTGLPTATSEALVAEIRAVAEVALFDLSHTFLEACGGVPALTLRRARWILETNQAIRAPTVFLSQRPLLGDTTYVLWRELVRDTSQTKLTSMGDVDLGLSTQIDCVSFLLAADLAPRVQASCDMITRSAHDALAEREGLSWLQRWARVFEVGMWADQIRVARCETWTAAHPLARRVNTLLCQPVIAHEMEDVLPCGNKLTLPSEAYVCVARDEDEEHLSLAGASSSVAHAIRGAVRLQVAADVVDTCVSCATRDVLCFRLRVYDGRFGKDEVGRIADMVAASELKHPSIVSGLTILDRPADFLIFDFDEENPTTLRDMLDQNGGVCDGHGCGDTIARLWLRQLCAGLDHLHAHGLVCRTLRAEHVLVSKDGYALRLVPLLPAEVDRAAPTLDRLDPHCVLTPPEATQVALSLTGEDLKFACAHNVSTHAKSWDSWSLGVVLAELLFGTKPLAWATQLERYFENIRRFRRGTVCKDVTDAAMLEATIESLHFDILTSQGPAAYVAALKRASLRSEENYDDREELPTWVRARNAVRANVAVLAADARLRGHTVERDFVSRRLAARLEEESYGTLVSPEIAHAVLVEDLHFFLDELELRAIVDDYEEWADLEELLVVPVDEPPDPHETLFACVVACLQPIPQRRVLPAELLRCELLTLTPEQAANARLDAGAYVEGVAPKPAHWFEANVREPLARLEADFKRSVNGEEEDLNISECVALINACTAFVRGDEEKMTALDRLVVEGDLERCVQFALGFGELEGVLQHVGGLVLATLQRSRLFARHTDCVLGIAAKFLLRAASRSEMEDAVFKAFIDIAPDHLRNLVTASRTLRDASCDGRVGRSGAVKALAALCLRGEDSQAARWLVNANAAARLLPLTANKSCADVRVDALRCCRNACEVGLSLSSGGDDPRLVLALQFSGIGWVAALARVLRSPGPTRAETDAAFEAMDIMVAGADLGMRAFCAGGAVTALIFAMQQGRAMEGLPGSACQDTSEAGGPRHRLLQPFSTRSDAGHLAATKARRVLSEILLGASAVCKLLNTAYPHVVNALL